MINKQGFRCDCQGCDGTPHYPCRAAEENEEERSIVESLRSRLKIASEALFTANESLSANEWPEDLDIEGVLREINAALEKLKS